MTELTFLVELLLNHKLQKPTKDAVASRIRDVEAAMATLPPTHPVRPMPNGVVQAASMQAIIDRNPDLAPAVVAQTPAAVAAINSRQTAINESLAGKIDKATGRPRKF